MMARLFGSGDDVDPAQLMLRLLCFMGFAIGVLGFAGGSRAEREAAECYPRCVVTEEQIAEAQAKSLQALPPSTLQVSALPVPGSTTTVPRLRTVAVYGDSRAQQLGEGMKLVPGQTVDNYGSPSCALLFATPQVSQYGWRCPSTDEYVAQGGHHDLAVVYAGTILTLWVDEQQWTFDQLVANLASSLALVDADRVLVLATPLSPHCANIGAPCGDIAKIELTDSAFSAASASLGPRFVFVDAFDEWVEAQTVDCEPDGLHFSIDCALTAALWLQGAA